MNRRTLLKWISRGLAFFCASFVAVPGVGFVVDSLRRKPASTATLKRIAMLKTLPVGRPILVPVIDNRRDAWTLHPAETVGRVWLVRRTDDSIDAAEAKIDAFTSVCPHLGCAINMAPSGENFTCPCHQASFGFDGAPLKPREPGQENVTPRGMDSLESQLVQDENTGEWWVEVKYEKFEPGLTRKVARA